MGKVSVYMCIFVLYMCRLNVEYIPGVSTLFTHAFFFGGGGIHVGMCITLTGALKRCLIVCLVLSKVASLYLGFTSCRQWLA